jgi:hypothetical protein
MGNEEMFQLNIDKAVFYNSGNQIYACYMYKNGVAVGNMTDTMGAYIHEVKELLQNKYPEIEIEVK